jgi:hypothetical protein
MCLLAAIAVLVLAPAVWAGVPCAGTSQVWAADDSVYYGDTVDVYVIISDCYGQPLANRVGNFYTDRAGDVIIGNPVITDITGFAQAELTAPCAAAGQQSAIYCNSEGVALGGNFIVFWLCTAGLRDLYGTPAGFLLCESSPNPFRETAQIRYGVPHRSSVAIEIYDITGRRVNTLVDGSVGPGYHTAVWNGTDQMGEHVAPGVYYAHMTAQGYSNTTKVMLLN